MVVEVVAGLLAASLALLSDAAHMLTDAAAIGLALVAAGLAARPARGRFTFGLGRAEILSAQANGATLLVLAGVIAVEAIGRLSSRPRSTAARRRGRPPRRGRERRRGVGARRAPSGAASTSRARGRTWSPTSTPRWPRLRRAVVLVAGSTGPTASRRCFVAALMLRSGLGPAARVRPRAARGGAARHGPEAIGEAMAREPGVVEVHDLHVWEVTSGFPALAAHVIVRPGDDCHAVRRRLQRVLGERFGVDHVTLQVDHAPDAAACSRSSRARAPALTRRGRRARSRGGPVHAAEAHRVARLAAAVGGAAGVEDREAVVGVDSWSGMCEWPNTTASRVREAAAQALEPAGGGPGVVDHPDPRPAGVDDPRRRQAHQDLGLVDVAVDRGDRRPERLDLLEDLECDEVAGVQDRSAERRRSTHASGSRRAPRGRCVSETIARSTSGRGRLWRRAARLARAARAARRRGLAVDHARTTLKAGRARPVGPISAESQRGGPARPRSSGRCRRA